MKSGSGAVAVAVVLLLLVGVNVPVMEARALAARHGRSHQRIKGADSSSTGEAAEAVVYWRRPAGREGRMQQPVRGRPADTVQVAGSRLPDCSHGCGSCSPCRLVMVSFVCSSLEEAETCPMAYKCMCHSKSFPVP